MSRLIPLTEDAARLRGELRREVGDSLGSGRHQLAGDLADLAADVCLHALLQLNKRTSGRRDPPLARSQLNDGSSPGELGDEPPDRVRQGTAFSVTVGAHCRQESLAERGIVRMGCRAKDQADQLGEQPNAGEALQGRKVDPVLDEVRNLSNLDGREGIQNQ